MFWLMYQHLQNVQTLSWAVWLVKHCSDSNQYFNDFTHKWVQDNNWGHSDAFNNISLLISWLASVNMYDGWQHCDFDSRPQKKSTWRENMLLRKTCLRKTKAKKQQWVTKKLQMQNRKNCHYHICFQLQCKNYKAGSKPNHCISVMQT